jgi:tetratricopeptide (TPR) repeat protein
VKRPAPYPYLLLLGTLCVSLATVLQPRAAAWQQESGGVLNRFLGESRRLFANQSFIQADVSFHSGYYPSMFDQGSAPKDSRHMTATEGSPEEEEHERQMNFLGPPRDWIERFGRNFLITEHSHLEGTREAEILPWLKVSAELDPQRVDTYTVASYWLRSLGKFAEAEQFLREGLRNNPGSYEILFELGKLYFENYKDSNRARNVWELALRSWHQQEDNKKSPDLVTFEQLTVHLSRIEEQAGNLPKAIEYLQMAAKVSVYSARLNQQIAELRQKSVKPN